jgi:sortase B
LAAGAQPPQEAPAVKRWKTVLCSVLALGFAAIIAVSGFQIWKIQEEYQNEQDMHRKALEYKPKPSPEAELPGNDVRALGPDVAGWLTIPNTKVDYPFVWYKDNAYYLRRDLSGGYALAGTIFMDCRCQKDFTSQNTILYGHHMKNGSMFGSLKQFANSHFFAQNQRGTIDLPNQTLQLRFFAFLVIDSSTEQELYTPAPGENYFTYVKQNAKYFRDIALSEHDRLVTLSTCAYEFNNARMVLLAKVEE